MIYPGGKNAAGTYQRIINQFPPHQIYLECFLGSGAILRAKRPAPVLNIGIDQDAGAIAAVSEALQDRSIPGLQLIAGDGLHYLAEKCWTSETLIYLDPPYLQSTRSSQRQLYLFELADTDHSRLLQIITNPPGKQRPMIAISGYRSNLYDQALANWRRIDYQVLTRAGSLVTECLWLNYPQPVELHQYNYLGSNFRERERIKRKIHRWSVRLANMPLLEKQAMMAALQKSGD